MKMKTACVIGPASFEQNVGGGESDKTWSVYFLCKKQYRETTLFSTRNKKRPISLFRNCVAALKKHDVIYVVVSIGGVKKLLPLIHFFNAFFKKKIIYCCVGTGTVPFEACGKNVDYERVTDFIKHSDKWKDGNKRFARTLRKNAANLFETKTLVDIYKRLYKLENCAVLTNFRFYEGTSPNARDVSPETIAIVFFARVSKQKGVDMLINVFSRLETRYQKSLRIDLFGPLQGDVDVQSLPEGISYKGVCRENKIDVLKKYDAMLFPTISYEGVPGSIVDARFASLPIISSDFCFAKDLVSDGVDGIIYEFQSEEGLCLALKSIVDNPLMLSRMRAHSFDRSKAFSYETAIGVLESI